MTYSEKIKRLTDGRSAAKLGRVVGLHKSAIRDVVNTGKRPRIDKAIKIARALGVTADWLFDDAQDWPPPSATPRSADAEAVLDLIARAARAIANTLEHEKGQRIAAEASTT